MTTAVTAPSLYVPHAYVAPDPVAIVRRFTFATIVTATAGGVFATQTPVLFERDDATDTMIGHLAKQNPHAQVLAPNQPVLALFQGPHTYVSASWYVDRPTVPTWNYVAAQLRGRLDPIDEPEDKIRVLERTAEIVEQGETVRWTMADAPAGRVATLLPMIRAFRIHVETIEAVTKLSQTHPQSDRERVMARLRARGDGDSLAIADWMANSSSVVG